MCNEIFYKYLSRLSKRSLLDLDTWKYNPETDIKYINGVIVPTTTFREEFKNSILNYFKERKEDNLRN